MRRSDPASCQALFDGLPGANDLVATLAQQPTPVKPLGGKTAGQVLVADGGATLVGPSRASHLFQRDLQSSVGSLKRGLAAISYEDENSPAPLRTPGR